MNTSVALTLLGKNVRVWRERRAMSSAGLAAACGLTHAEVQALERGEFEIRLDDLQMISDLLDVRIADFFAPDGEHQTACVVETRAV